jgi:hypothetical protein
MNSWEALASLQALLIYTVVRVDEGETEYNNLDSLIQSSIIVSFEEFKSFVFATITRLTSSHRLSPIPLIRAIRIRTKLPPSLDQARPGRTGYFRSQVEGETRTNLPV